VARGLKPNGAKGQYQIRVNASHNGQTASISIAQTNAILTASGTAASTSVLSTKLIVVLAAVGAAAAAGGAYYATHSGGTTQIPVAPPGTTIAAGAGSVGPPR
jgi:hypothetical protein